MLVGTFNVWGNVGHQGKADWIGDALAEVLTQPPAALALQEACRNQAQEFASRLGMRMEFMKLMPHRCDNGEDFGNAVLYRGTATGPVVRRIMPGIDEDEPRGLICVPLTEALFCAIHLSIDQGRRLGQTSWLSEVEQGKDPELRPLGKWGPVLLAGDFNAEPRDPELDALYSTIGAKEALGPRAAATTPTHNDNRKIDYIFTWGGGALGGTTAVPSRYSDHYFYSTWFSY
jgi:endonuclease/exonuclease/phosphatase family metal-dependent hydrolase